MRRPQLFFLGLLGGLVLLGALGYWSLGGETMGRILIGLSLAGIIASVLVAARQQGTRPSPVTLTTALGGIFLFDWTWWLWDASWWQRLLVTAVGVMPLMSLSNAAFRADIRRGQRRRNAEAARIPATLRAGGTPRFSLYLRPFATTERLAAQPLPPGLGPGDGLPVHLDTETLLARALRADCPLVALGRPGDILEGAARISTTDDDWQATMALLAQRAEFIVMTPLARASTIWELAWLAEHDLLGKVVMVMPETVAEAPSGVVYTARRDARLFDSGVQRWDPEPHRIDLAREWRNATVAAAEHGVALPSQAAAGALFTLTPGTGAVARILPLALSTSARRVRYVREALAALRAQPEPDIAALLARGTAYRGTTLAFALVKAADGFLLWSAPATAVALLTRALEEGGDFVAGYLHQLPALVRERREMDDGAAIAACRDGAAALMRVPALADRAPRDLARELASADEPPPTVDR